MDFIRSRSWMYNRTNPGRAGLTDEFVVGVYEFVQHACSLSKYENEGVIRCPCKKCKSTKAISADDVTLHLLKHGFKPKYWWWTDHGEVEPPEFHSILTAYLNEQENVGASVNAESSHRYHDMVTDAYNSEFMGSAQRDFQRTVDQPPNEEAQKFYDLLKSASSPLWEGSAHSELSLAVRLMSIKSDWNVQQNCMDAMIQLMSEVSPHLELDHRKTYSQTKKLVSKLGLSSQKIDCCPGGCMLYYKDDSELEECKFCQQPRYRTESTSKGKRVSFRVMHYLPLIPRLQRLYASMSSAPHMRWHYENRRPNGVFCHPSDGLAWQHFNQIYPDFAMDPRNIRLGLCADGFTPFSMLSTPYSC